MRIEKSVPVPQDVKGKKKYPFADMDVGDSVFCSGSGHRSKEAEAAKRVGKYHGRKFVMRRENDGIRIWRTE